MSCNVLSVRLFHDGSLHSSIERQIDVILHSHHAVFGHLFARTLKRLLLCLLGVACVLCIEGLAPFIDVDASKRTIIPNAMLLRCICPSSGFLGPRASEPKREFGSSVWFDYAACWR
ncbi:hypothetical protein, partial [Yoonia sediminilitoris]